MSKLGVANYSVRGGHSYENREPRRTFAEEPSEEGTDVLLLGDHGLLQRGPPREVPEFPRK